MPHIDSYSDIDKQKQKEIMKRMMDLFEETRKVTKEELLVMVCSKTIH